MTDQRQRTGDRSLNVQAGRDVSVGLSYMDVRQVALDVYKANFLEMAGQAADLAASRAEEITDKFLQHLSERYPLAIENAVEPDMQRALFRVLESYASHGDEQIGDLLVELLVERTAQKGRSLRQVVLDEALQTVPRLTNDQLAALSIIFYVRNAKHLDLDSPSSLYLGLADYVDPFLDEVPINRSSYLHLQYAGCIALGVTGISIPEILRRIYPGLLSKGLNPHSIPDDLPAAAFVPCLRDPNVRQVNAVDLDGVELLVEREDWSGAVALQLRSLLLQNLLSDDELEEEMIQVAPRLQALLSTWKFSSMPLAEVTSVGIAIGHANVSRRTSLEGDLELFLQ